MPTPPSDAYRFHAFEVSYFSAKVRPALRYKRVWFEEIHPDYGLIRARTGHTYVPMLLTPDDQAWQDSTDIYDRLEERYPEPPLFPTTPVQRIAAHLVELYVAPSSGAALEISETVAAWLFASSDYTDMMDRQRALDAATDHGPSLPCGGGS